MTTKGNVQINTFIGGMNTDSDVAVLPSNQYTWAENVRVVTNDAGTTGVLQNIEGFQEITQSALSATENVLAATSIRDYGIVITWDGTANSIYRFDFSSNKLVPTVVKVLYANLGITTTLDVVANYEADDLIKIYFTDGNSPLKVFNIMDESFIGITSWEAKDFEILPKAYLPPMTIIGLDSGTLYGGVIQYCYQLFNVNGTESTLSALSPLVHLTSSRTESSGKSYKGVLANQNAGKSVKIKATGISTNFNKARIVSVHYFSNNELPVISVVDEIDVTTDSIYYEDRGSTVLNELTVEQFNDMIGYDFIANNIEKLDNMLFAANIKENTWDIDYDARAYRCNPSGVVKLLDNSSINPLTFNITSLTASTVPEDHDCINPYNNLELSALPEVDDCQYVQVSSGVFAKGGKGVNVSYRLITTDLIEDDSAIAGTTSNGIPLFQNDLNLGISSRTVSGLSIHKKLVDGTDTREFEEFTDIPHSRLMNYADPFIASKYKGYTRDEVYRFGLIMYNDKNVPSPVHWIADIRMPHASDDHYRPFTNNESIYSSVSSTEGPYTLLSHPLGVQFSIANLPSEVKAVEIVRCERTVADKTVLMQGAISKVGNYKHMSGKDGSDSAGNRDIRPFTYLTYGHLFGSKVYAQDRDWNDHDFDDGMRPPLSQSQSDSYYNFISPDVCVNRENTIPLLNDTMKIDTIYGAASPTHSTYVSGSSSKQRVMSYAGTRFDDKNNLITILSGDSQRIYGTIETFLPDGSGTDAIPCVMYMADMTDTAVNFEDISLQVAVNLGYISKYYFLYRNAFIVKKEGGVLSQAMTTDLAKKTANVDAIEYSNLLDYSDYVSIKNKPTVIGENIYFNWAHSNYANNKDEDRTAKEGPSGVSLIFKSEDLKNKVYGITSVLPIGNNDSTIGKGYSTNTILMANLKKNIIPYGGNTYTARQNSVYISTGIYLKNTGSQLTVNCFGGDTFLGILDYARTMMFFNTEDPANAAKKRIYVGAYLPIESGVNLHLRADTPISKTYDSGSGFANVFVQNEVGQVFTAAVQSVPMYAYNGAYSSQNGSRKYIPKSIYDRDDVTNDNRIIASQAKTSGEVIDSWSKFKYANYIDVDSQYGPITNMHVFKNRLFFWQDSAVGVASVNERSLITDNNPGALVLGTGGILARFDYVTDKNGARKGDYNNITHSDSGVYWYDCNKNEACVYSGNNITLSKLKGVQSYLNSLPLVVRTNSTVFYDKKYNEVQFVINKKPLAFSEQINAFTSLYTNNVNWHFDLRDAYYTIGDNNKIKLHNTNNLAGVTSLVEFVVNDNYEMTKTFDNVSMSGDFTDNEVFTNIHFNTKVQTTAPINYNDIDYREDTYRFAIGRSTDNGISRMRGKYLYCSYSFDCTNDKSFRLPLIKTSYRYSMV